MSQSHGAQLVCGCRLARPRLFLSAREIFFRARRTGCEREMKTDQIKRPRYRSQMKSFRSLLAELFLVGAVVASGPRAALAEEPPPGGAPSEPSVQVEPSGKRPPAPEPEPSATNVSPAPVSNLPAPAPPAVPAVPAVSPGTSEGGDRTFPTAPPPETRFGGAGQFVFGGALSASLGRLGFGAGGSTTSFSIQPAFDYFAAPNFSLGVSGQLRHIDNEPGTSGNSYIPGTSTLTLGLGAAVGFNAWLAERVSVWPRLSLGVSQNRQTFSSPTGLVSASGTAVQVAAGPEVQTIVVVELFAPFLVHPTQHFFVGFGPDLYADLHNTFNGASNKRTFLGAQSTVGGWF
jgi:hypothetical protein